MALIICKECGKEYSDKSPSCPNCGCPTEGFIQGEQGNSITPLPSTDFSDASLAVKKGKKHVNKKVLFITIGSVVVVLVAAYLWYWLLCPKTIPFFCYHKTKAAKCTTAEKCIRCGKEFGQPLGHKWVDATCTNPKTCKVCGETKGEAIGHSWKAATCTEPKTCTVCNMTDGDPIGHKWKNATCTAPKTCSVCNERSGSSLGHEVKNYICTRCKKSFVNTGDVPNIIEFSNLKYSINSVGGVDIYFKITNKSSSKTIKYVRMTINFYNNVGDKVRDDITGKTYTDRQWVGPLGPKKSEQVSASAVFYNSTARAFAFSYLEIEYTDGTVLKIEDEIACFAAMKY